jgi:hypothetical protein
MVNACNNSLKPKRDLHIEIPISEMMYSGNNRLLNYSYKFPESVYSLLEIDAFKKITRKYRVLRTVFPK